MQFSCKQILKFAVEADDGVCGSVRDILFDDDTWNIRYLVMRANDSRPLADFQLPVDRIRFIDLAAREVHYRGTKAEAQSSSLIDIDPPISRQEQIKRSAIWALAPIYEFDFTWGTFPIQPTLFTRPSRSSGTEKRAADNRENTYDPHLRSSREVTGYKVQAPDGKAGRVVDILFDDGNYQTQYLVIDVARFWRHTRLLLPVSAVHGICWSLMRVSTSMSKRDVRSLASDSSQGSGPTRAEDAGGHGTSLSSAR